MISFKQFVAEDSNKNLSVLGAEEIALAIFNECQPFLRESKFNPKKASTTGLHRGMYHNNSGTLSSTVIKYTASINRTPKDSSHEMQKILDKYFLEKFGYRFRADGTFCSYSSTLVADYGHTYLIFPVGDFKFCYSKIIDDAYLFFDNSKNDEDPEGLKTIETVLGRKIDLDIRDQPDDQKAWAEIVNEFLRKTDPYIDTNLPGAQNNIGRIPPEIMIGCKSYYGLYFPSFPSDNPMRAKANNVLAELSKLL